MDSESEAKIIVRKSFYHVPHLRILPPSPNQQTVDYIRQDARSMTINKIIHDCSVSESESLAESCPPLPATIVIPTTPPDNHSLEIGTDQDYSLRAEDVTKRL